MDVMNSFLNSLLSSISLAAFFFILPANLIFKFLSFIIRSIFFIEDVAGKVVLITGASSGIGEHLACEYAKRGAYLALVARRENRLREVADVAEILGSPYALVIKGDVSKIEDCKRCIDTTITHFGRLDHLVNNAGITSINLFEEYDDVQNMASVMDINFWGTVYCTYNAIPHLKRSRGKIIGISSSAELINQTDMNSMDLVKNFFNLVLTATSLIAFTFFLPPYLFFKFLSFLIRLSSSEDVPGKVVLITGASSGIGEHLAYEYAKRGAYLALAARRENRLREVAAVSESLGSPYALVIPADISQIQDCERCVDATVTHFGRLDHLVNNAGVSSINLFEEYDNLQNAVPIMDLNFWGMVYCTYFAIPHLKESRGKIIGIASSAAWLPTPRLSFYRASKAAVIGFYETLRVEVGREIGISIMTPGIIESEMTRGKLMSKEGHLQLDQQLRNAVLSVMPVMPISGAVEGIFRSGCRGDPYTTEPPWMRMAFHYATLCPGLVEWINRFIIMTLTAART